MSDVLKQLEEVVRWQQKYLGMQEMQMEVGMWLIEHASEITPELAQSLFSYMQARAAVEVAKHPTVDDLPNLKVV